MYTLSAHQVTASNLPRGKFTVNSRWPNLTNSLYTFSLYINICRKSKNTRGLKELLLSAQTIRAESCKLGWVLTHTHTHVCSWCISKTTGIVCSHRIAYTSSGYGHENPGSIMTVILTCSLGKIYHFLYANELLQYPSPPPSPKWAWKRSRCARWHMHL